MTEKFDALVWKAQEVDIHGDTITPEALRDMADGLPPGSSISDDFDFWQRVGDVAQAWIDGHDLYVTATFDDADMVELLRQGKYAIRPGFSIEAMHKDAAGNVVIDKIGVTHVAVTPNPIPLPGEQPNA